MAKRKRCRFARNEVEIEGYVVAGSPDAVEALGPMAGESPSCVNCGARLKNVFLTSVGPMGGDCLATCTGDDSTRKVVYKILKSLRQKLGWERPVRILIEDGRRGANPYTVSIMARTEDSYVEPWSGELVGLRKIYVGSFGDLGAMAVIGAVIGEADDRDVPVEIDKELGQDLGF